MKKVQERIIIFVVCIHIKYTRPNNYAESGKKQRMYGVPTEKVLILLDGS